jgi:hypothetical protein
MYIIRYVKLAFCTNNFGGTKLKRNDIWGYANKKCLIPLVYTIDIFGDYCELVSGNRLQ